jgi:hypothetical protein
MNPLTVRNLENSRIWQRELSTDSWLRNLKWLPSTWNESFRRASKKYQGQTFSIFSIYSDFLKFPVWWHFCVSWRFSRGKLPLSCWSSCFSVTLCHALAILFILGVYYYDHQSFAYTRGQVVKSGTANSGNKSISTTSTRNFLETESVCVLQPQEKLNRRRKPNRTKLGTRKLCQWVQWLKTELCTHEGDEERKIWPVHPTKDKRIRHEAREKSWIAWATL